VGYGITWDNFDAALVQASRSPIEKACDEFMAAMQPANEAKVLIRPGIGQVLAVGGVPVGDGAASDRSSTTARSADAGLRAGVQVVGEMDQHPVAAARALAPGSGQGLEARGWG